MDVTKISDVVVPELFSQYVMEKTTAVSKIIQSGVVTASPELDRLATGGGREVNMPFWNFIGGEDELLSDGTPLTPDKMTASQDVAVRLLRGKAWMSNDLAGVLAGSDPMGALVTMVGDWWAAREQAIFISILKGVFTAPTMQNHILDKSTEVINAKLILDGKQLLGDNAAKLKTLVMHSATYTDLQKQNLIEFIPYGEAKIDMPTYLGYKVIYDDTVPVVNGVYSTYLVGDGAFGRGQGAPETLPATEIDRDTLGGNDILTNRKSLVMHPFGVKWTGSAAGSSPSNAELATGSNWTKVYDSKNIPMVEIKHKVGV